MKAACFAAFSLNIFHRTHFRTSTAFICAVAVSQFRTIQYEKFSYFRKFQEMLIVQNRDSLTST
jgi:hypothetical protein